MPYSNMRCASPIPIAIFVCLFGVLPLCSGCQRLTTLCCSIPQLPWQRTQVQLPVASPPTYSTYVSPLFASAPPRRVVMIESGPSNGNYEQSNRMIAELASQVRSAGLFEVVTPRNTQLSSHMDNILNGRFHELEVAQLASQYNADAVAFVRVNELRGFSPMRASITLAIVDANETVVAFAVDGNWDTANASTQQAFTDHLNSHIQSVPVSIDVRLQSPRALMEFASAQIAELIGQSIR